MTFSDLEENEFFSTTGKDVWRRESYFAGPSVTLVNLQTGERQNFGLNGLTAQNYKPMVMKP